MQSLLGLVNGGQTGLFSMCLWFGLQFLLDYGCPMFFRQGYDKLRARLAQHKRANETTAALLRDVRTRVVSTLFCTSAVAGLLYILATDGLSIADMRNLHGEFPKARLLCQWTAGFFVWDVVVTVVEGWGPAFLAHAVLCLLVFTGSQLPFSLCCGVFVLCYELSTPWMHARSLLRNFGFSADSKPFQAASIIFFVTFAFSRILLGMPFTFVFCMEIIGTWSSCYHAFSWDFDPFRGLFGGVLSSHRDFAHCSHFNPVIYGFYLLAASALAGLNTLWFSQMLVLLIKRTPSEQGDRELSSSTLLTNNSDEKPKDQ